MEVEIKASPRFEGFKRLVKREFTTLGMAMRLKAKRAHRRLDIWPGSEEEEGIPLHHKVVMVEKQW